MLDFHTIYYLNCPSDICLARVRNRNRLEEESINLSYLGAVNTYYQKWYENGLKPLKHKNYIIELDASKTTDYLCNYIVDQLID